MGYKELFGFKRQERNGIIVFFILSFIVCIGAEYWPKKEQSNTDLDLAAYYISSDSLSSDEENDFVINEYYYENNYKKKTLEKQRFPFDPNTLSYDSLLLLGISKFAAKNLTNFVSKGGKIKDIQKLKSIYGIDSLLINDLEPLISFDNGKLPSFVFEKREDFKEKFKEIEKTIDINTADSLDWISLKGIGPYTASKILKYRARLGGFLNMEQFLEAGLIKDSLYEILMPLLEIQTVELKKININTADYKEFLNHPYFTSEQARAIIKYRNQHGSFSDPKHIRRIKSLKEEWGIKIIPYLKVD